MGLFVKGKGVGGWVRAIIEWHNIQKMLANLFKNAKFAHIYYLIRRWLKIVPA